ncbi:MAG: M16 family metallopeptidase, partial [Microgenomates group bacterium]
MLEYQRQMDYKLSQLSSGLRLVSVPMKSSESATLTVWVKTGSRNEDKKVNGISHFLEHMVFKGSKKYPNTKVLSEVFDAMGAVHNASTSKEWTNFWVKLPKADLEKGFDVISDTMLRPLFDPKEIERERQVILQEINMYEDTPMIQIGEFFEGLVYGGSKLGWEISGDKESLHNIDRDEFIKYRDSNYFGENMLVSIAGGVNESQTRILSEKYFKGLPKLGSKPHYEEFNDKQDKPRLRLKSKKNEQAHFILGFMSQGRGYEGRFAQAVLSSILGGGLSSRLLIEVREKRGLAYAVKGSMDRYFDAGYFGVYAGVAPDKIEDAIKVIKDECYGIANKAKKSLISKKEFEKARGYIKGRLALAMEDSEAVGDFFSEQILFDKKVLTPEETFKLVDKVTVDQVY